MQSLIRFACAFVCAATMLALSGPAGAAEDARVTSYKKEVHLTAEQLRARSKDLVAWQKNNWVAPRACSGSTLSWAKAPAGKPTALYDCAPFQCSGEGVCRQECSSDAHCVGGAKCLDLDASGQNGVCAGP